MNLFDESSLEGEAFQSFSLWKEMTDDHGFSSIDEDKRLSESTSPPAFFPIRRKPNEVADHAYVDFLEAAIKDQHAHYQQLLLDALADNSHIIREGAARILSELTDFRPVKELLSQLEKETVAQVQEALLWAVGNWRAIEALPLLEILAKFEDNFYIRQTAVWAFGEIREPTSFIIVREILMKDISPHVRIEATKSLRLIGGERSRPTLQAVLFDNNQEVRSVAREQLEELGYH